MTKDDLAKGALVGGLLGVLLLPAIAGAVGGYYVSGRHWWGALVGVVVLPAALSLVRSAPASAAA